MITSDWVHLIDAPLPPDQYRNCGTKETVMTQELAELRTSILSGRYDEALMLVDELEEMSKKAILQKIESFLVRMLIHLIKNQVEQRLTNSWAASIRDSVLKIQGLNLKDNKTAYYIKQEEWTDNLERAFKDAIYEASVEVSNGIYKPRQLREIVDKTQIMNAANQLISLTYSHSDDSLRDVIDEEFTQLPGGEDWIWNYWVCYLSIAYQIAPVLPQDATSSYEELYNMLVAKEPEPERKFNLQFLTPTALTVDGVRLPLPLPQSLFRSWLERWNHFGPVYLGGDELLGYLTGARTLKGPATGTKPAQAG